MNRRLGVLARIGIVGCLLGGAIFAGCSNDAAPAPDFSSFDLAAPDLALPDLAVPDLAPPDLAVPDLEMPDLAEPDLAVPDLESPDLTSSLPSDGGSSDDMPDLRTAYDFFSAVQCDPAFCAATSYCNGYIPCPTRFDPCRPQYCNQIGAQCIPLPIAPDYTPCDDIDGCSHVYPATGGCPSNKCVGGANDGVACSSDAQCPGGYCFMNRCIDGPNAGSACNTNADCTGGAPNADCVLQVGRKAYCKDGAEAGHFCKAKCVLGGGVCASNPDGACPPRCIGGTNDGATPCVSLCTGGTCTGNVCVGGTNDGKTCCPGGICHRTCQGVPNSPDRPPAGRCVRWAPDPATGTCRGSTNNPFCNTVADCPTTKYCAGDPENINGSSTTSCFATNQAEDCCLGGQLYGPCQVWDSCDTVNHVCVRTTQGNQLVTCGLFSGLKYGDVPCLGGPRGMGGIADGGVCNNICLSGVCTSTSGSCL